MATVSVATGLATVGAACADEIFIYSSQANIRGVNLDLGLDWPVTASPIASSVNALALNDEAGLVYYGDQTSVYRWDPALGSGAAAHTLMNDFSVGPITAPLTNLNSTAGSYLNGKYYVGSEGNNGYIEELYELTMSIDGTQVSSIQPLGLLAACGCTGVQIGGFGDVAALDEGGVAVIYGSSADLSGTGAGTSAGRWRFVPSTSSFTLLSAGSGGQMSSSPSGLLYSNVGNSIREVDKLTGNISNTSLFTTSASIYDFTGGFVLDFGDAPDTYGSAFHRQPQGAAVHIGAVAPDNEPASLNASTGANDGSGDDDVGTDDEDAVNNLPPVDAASGQYSVTVSCTAGTRVAGWIDTNINGVFDTTERNNNHPVSCSAGQAQLQWLALGAAVPGNSYMRLRASTNTSAISKPRGVASDGEVEDHPVSIIAGSGGGGGGSCVVGQSSTVYNAADLPRSIGPRRNTVTVSTIPVSDTATVVDVNVLNVVGTHTDINDLLFDLRHNGVSRRLYGPSCNSQNNFSFSFDDASSGTPPCPPIDGGSYPPVNALDQFNGQSANGNWDLIITDRRNRDGGSLAGWSLEICTAAAPVESPDVRIGKLASVVDRTVNFTINALNTGDSALSSVQIQDDLDGVFGVSNYTLLGVPVLQNGPAGIVLDPSFNGSAANINLLASGSSLNPGEAVQITFSVRVDTIALTANPGLYANQVLISGNSAGGSAISDLSNDSIDLSIDADQATVFNVDVSALLSGSVFVDTSNIASQSHDGIRQSGETGLSNRQINIIDVNGSTIAVTQTDASGNWQASIPAPFLNQNLLVRVQADTSTVFVSEDAAFTVAAVNDGELAVVAGYGESISGINAGVIERPSLRRDQSSNINAGGWARYAHEFEATSHGVLNLSIQKNDNPLTPVWSERLVLDSNCNGIADPGEGSIPATIALQAGAIACVVYETFAPSNVAANASSQILLSAEFQLDDLAGTGHNTLFSLNNTDLTTVSQAGSGRLVLDKTVRNITTNDVVRLSNAALPGHVLEYVISYSNAGSAAISELSIDDAAPAFTGVVAGSAACLGTPAGIACTPQVSGPNVSWTFIGSLPAGSAGQVRYQVLVE